MSWLLADSSREKGTNGLTAGSPGTVESRGRTLDALDARTAAPPMGSTVSTPTPPDPEGASCTPRPASPGGKNPPRFPRRARTRSLTSHLDSRHALTPPPARSPASRRVPSRRPAAERHVRAPRPRRAVAARQRDRVGACARPRRVGHPKKRRALQSRRRVGGVVGGVVSRRPRDGG